MRKSTKGKSVNKKIWSIKYKGSEGYGAIIDYFDSYWSEGGAVTAAYDGINTLKVKTCNTEVWRTT